MTKFICQELLYEFATGNLDLERQKALDIHLTGCRESQRELEKLKAGFQFTARLAKVEVSSNLKAALLGFEPSWKRNLRQWTLFWSLHGWKALPYAVLAVVIVLTVLVFKPWTTAGQKEVVLVETAKQEADRTPPPDDVKVENPAVTPVVPKVESSEAVKADKPSLVTTHEAAVAKPAPTPTPPPPPSPLASAEKGILFRAEIEVGNFAEATSQIREKITALDGKPAGQEELGVEREKGTASFHFSLPESNRAELEEFLKTFGPVRFKQEAHPRVMPDGEIHIILTIKDGSPNEPSEETETP